MDLREYLGIMVEREGSDLYFSDGAPVGAKIHGALTPIDEHVLDRDEVKAIAWSIMDEEQIAEFEHKPEMNLAISEDASAVSGSTSSSNATALPW